MTSALAEVLEKLEMASEGRWYVERMADNEFGQQVYQLSMEGGDFSIVESAEFYGDRHDADAAVAAVNWLREHGPALLRDAGDGAKDSARLDWLIEQHATLFTDGEGYWQVAWEFTNPVTFGPMADSPRAAIDAAMHAPGGAGGGLE